MSEILYKIPIIPQDLRNEETIIQISQSLEFLKNVADDIFTRIDERIILNKEKLKAIQERISITNSQVTKLTGSNKATKVSKMIWQVQSRDSWARTYL